MPRHSTFAPRTEIYSVPVRAAHPISVWMASALGWLHGRAIAGDNGKIIIGQPGLNSGKATGYYVVPQMFVGWNPRKVAAGAVRPTPAGLPGTQAPAGEPPNALTLAIARLSGLTGGT